MPRSCCCARVQRLRWRRSRRACRPSPAGRSRCTPGRCPVARPRCCCCPVAASQRRSSDCSPPRGWTSCRRRAAWARHDLLQAMPALRARLAQVDAELLANERQRSDLAQRDRPGLQALQARLHDLLLLAEAQAQVRCGELLFVIEGWLPEPSLAPLRAARRARARPGDRRRQARHRAMDARRGAGRAGQSAAVPALRADHARVPAAALRHDRPDAVRRRVLPDVLRPDAGRRRLRRCCSAVIAALLRWRSRPGGTLRVGRRDGAGAVRCFAIVFGFLFGEFFGDLGARLFGMRALAFDREKALVAVPRSSPWRSGVVHVVLGLVLGVVGAWRRASRRQAVGRGADDRDDRAHRARAARPRSGCCPRALFTPAAIALLVAFPVLIALEGSSPSSSCCRPSATSCPTRGSWRSAPRRVMLAIVANRMVGALGSVARRRRASRCCSTSSTSRSGCSARRSTRCACTTSSSSASSTAPAGPPTGP